MVRSWVVVAFALSLPRAAGAAPAAGHTPFRARCDVAAGDPENAEWMTWSRKAIPIMQGDVNFSPVERLAVKDAARTARMLRLGLAACDPLAAQAIDVTKLHALLPELKDLLDSANVAGSLLFGRGAFASFRVHVVRAANTLEPATDYAPYLIPLLSEPDTMVRIDAAMGARDFHRDSVSKALLATVARDGSYLVRYHAAESLLVLAGVYPQGIADHGAIFDRLKGGGDSLDWAFGQAPNAADLARYAEAARMLEDLIAANSPGKCSAPVRPTIIHVKVLRVNPHVVAVAFDAAESSCGTEPALVMFVESTKGFCGLLSGVESHRDPTTIELGTPSGDIVVEYARATGIARVRGVEIGKTDNVALLAASADGRTTAKWRGRLDTKTRRGGDVVQALLAQSAALKKMVQP